jgi:hypothetical protein
MRNLILITFIVLCTSNLKSQFLFTDHIGDFLVRISDKTKVAQKVLILDTKEEDVNKQWKSQLLEGEVLYHIGSNRGVVVVTHSVRLYGYGFGYNKFYPPQPMDGSFTGSEDHIFSSNGRIGVLTDQYVYVFSPVDDQTYSWTHQRVQGNIIKLLIINDYIIALTDTYIYTRNLKNVWEHFPIEGGTMKNTITLNNNRLIVESPQANIYVFLGNGTWQKH